MKILVIGAGNIGLTYAEGMSASELLKNQPLMISDNSQEKILSLQKNPKYKAYHALNECLPEAEIVFLAVKPYNIFELFEEMKPLMKSNQIVISIMAGVTIKTIQDGLGVKKVVRAMPNLPAMVAKGVTTYTSVDEISSTELSNIGNLLDTTGKSLHVKNEKFIDASTGISGSGPAYVFYFMQGLMEAALEMDFSEEEAKLLVTQTFDGAITLFNQSDVSLQTWMERVTSKGGTTHAALEAMKNNHVKEHIKEGAFAAFQRAIELGNNK